MVAQVLDELGLVAEGVHLAGGDGSLEGFYRLGRSALLPQLVADVEPDPFRAESDSPSEAPLGLRMASSLTQVTSRVGRNIGVAGDKSFSEGDIEIAHASRVERVPMAAELLKLGGGRSNREVPLLPW